MKVVLQPCKIREDRVVDLKQDQVELEWEALCELLAPAQSVAEKTTLFSLTCDAFVGVIRGAKTGRPTSFILANTDRSNSIAWLLKKDPSVPDRVVSIYRVQKVMHKGSMMEMKGDAAP